MFWERFFEQCTKLGTKPNPLGEKVGISSSTITQWKQGAIPGGDNLVKVANELKCSIDYLLGRTNNPLSHTCSITTGDISLSNNSVVGDGQVGVTIHNGTNNDQQITDLVTAFNKLDTFDRAEVIMHIKKLIQDKNL